MDMKTIGMVMVAVVLVFTVYMEVKKRTTIGKLETYLAKGDFESYIKLVDRPLTSILYPKYNVLFLRLNATMALSDAEQTERTIEQMAKLKMNDEQRLALAVKAFSFYVDVEDKRKAKEALKYIEKHGGKEAARVNRRTYDIFLKNRAPIFPRWSMRLRRRLRPTRSCFASCSPCNMRTRAITRGRLHTVSESSASWMRRLARTRPRSNSACATARGAQGLSFACASAAPKSP